MRLTNKLHLPQPIMDAVANDGYNRGAADISVTQLIDPPRKVELTRRHEDELEEDVSDRIFALFGQAIHTILERANRDGDVENRLFAKVGDWTVSGQYDRIVLAEEGIARETRETTIEGSGSSTGHILQDWKTAKVYEIINGPKPERELQLNVLAWLAKLHGYQIDAVEDIFILRDWSKVQAARRPGYPQKQVVVIRMPLWPMEKAEAYVQERIALHKAVREGGVLPECTREERWADPDAWAVMRPGNKRAVKLLTWEAEAYAYINQKGKPGDYVEQRPAESIRCAYYCLAAQVCSQWADMKPAETMDDDDG